jgi:hypothetical protein
MYYMDILLCSLAYVFKVVGIKLPLCKLIFIVKTRFNTK